MTEAIHDNYECSSEGAVRHWEVSYARLVDATPTPTNPAQLLGTAGLQLNGTILTIDAVDSIAIIDFTCSMVYNFYVRTALTYSGAAENTWGAINEGVPIYYDDSATMPVGVYLSLSPLNNLGTANSLFGWAVRGNEVDTFPKAAGVAGNTHWQAVMQRGAGG